MPRIVPALPCTPEQREMLECLIRGRKIEARLKERARIVLRGIDGVGIKDTAKEMGLNKDTVSLWRCRFLTAGVAGLHDQPRSGAPRKHGLNCANASWRNLNWRHQRDLATGTAPCLQTPWEC